MSKSSITPNRPTITANGRPHIQPNPRPVLPRPERPVIGKPRPGMEMEPQQALALAILLFDFELEETQAAIQAAHEWLVQATAAKQALEKLRAELVGEVAEAAA